MNAKFLSSGEKKKLLAELNERFGIEKLNYIFVETGKQKIRAFSGTLSKEELVRLGDFARVELIGLYFARRDDMSGLRLSLDALHLIKNQINKSVIEIDDNQFGEWMQGMNLDISIGKGVYVVKHKGDILGCGFSSGNKLFNYVPRERQAKRV